MVFFHPDSLALSPSILTRGAKWPALPARADTTHAAPELTETATPDPATPAAVGFGKINSNRARPTDGQTASPSPPADPDSDVTLAASLVGSDGDSDYVDSEEKSPMSLSNTPDLTGHIRELEAIHEVSEGDIDAIARPTVLFSHTNELKIPELVNAETNPLKNLQYNGATPPVNTHTYLPQSPPEDTSFASSEPPPCPCIEAGEAALQARTGDLPDVCLLGANYMIYGVYHYWVHQNPGEQLDGAITEDSKWQARWEKLGCIPTQCYDVPSRKVREIFV